MESYSREFEEELRILLFEFIGTALFAYGIICSRGNDYLISLYLFVGIVVSGPISGVYYFL